MILILILFSSLIWLAKFSCINPSGWSEALLGLLVMGTILTLVMLVFFLILLGLVKSLGSGLRGGQLRILIQKLRNLGFWIFYSGFLERRFDNFDRLIAVSNMLFYLFKHWKRYKADFGLSFNGFFY